MHPLEKFEYCPKCGSHHFVECGARSLPTSCSDTKLIWRPPLQKIAPWLAPSIQANDLQ